MTASQEVPLPTPETQPPIYVGGGFGYNERRNTEMLGYIGQLGYDTVSPLPDPNANGKASFTIAVGGMRRQVNALQAKRFLSKSSVPDGSFEITSDYQQERAQHLASMLEERGGAPVNAVLQSADALSGMQALFERPELFNAAILAFPAGLIRRPPIGKAITGLAKSGFRDRLNSRKADLDNNFEAGFKQPRKEAMVGGSVIPMSVAFSYQAPLLSKLRQNEDVPSVSLVLGINDAMTPASLVLDGLRDSQDVDYVLVTDASHGVNGRKDVMDDMLKLFPMMEDLKAARKAGEPLQPLAKRIIFYDSIPEAKRQELLAIAAKIDQHSGFAAS